ncbi:MAG: protein kinase [Myxococcales bacterium]|nr:protein kinase [Myxococcales bacterium]
MPHPSVSELLAAGDGAVDPAVAAHLAACASCRRLTERSRPVARAEEIARGDDDLAELPAVDPALYLRLERVPEQRGGMGRTFVARDRRLGREVAIKQPLGPADVPDPLLRATLRARFEREARLTARLEHPAIVGVYEAGRFRDGEAFYAMRRVQGRSLAEVIAELPGLGDRLALLPNLTIVAEALAYAHSRGVIHRDVTPANILVGAFGETVLIDWGLAADAASQHVGAPPADVYRRGEIALTDYGVGTPGYVAPEQLRGNAPDAAADIFGLGATLYHLLAGRPPPTADRRPLPAEVPPPLAALVARAMAERPSERFATVAELAAELKRFHTGQLMASHRYTPRELVRHYLRRYRAPAVIAAIAAVVLIAGGALYVRGLARSRDRIERARAAAEASDRAAQAALRRQRGVTASQLAAIPARRLEAIAEGVRAVAPELRAGRAPAPEAWQGLIDALAAGPVGAPLIGHHGALNAATFTRDGATLLTAGPDHTVRTWAVPSGAPRAVLASRLERPHSIAVMPDGARALVCGYDALAELLPLDGGGGRGIPLPLGDPQCGVTPRGEAVIVSGAQAQVLAAAAAVVASVTLPANATALGVSPSGLIAIGTVAGDLVLWRPGASPTVVPAAHRASLRTATFFDGGARLLTGGDDGRVLGWALRGDAPDAAAVVADRPGALSPEVLALGDGRLAVSVALSLTRRHDHETLIVGGARAITIDDWATVPVSGRPTTPALAGMSPDGGRLYDPATGRAVLRLPAPADIVHAARRDADNLLVMSMDGAAMLWDLRSGGATGQLLGHGGEITSLLAIDDRLWSASLDGTMRGWSTTSADASALDLGTELVDAIVAPDRRTLALLGVDGTVRVIATTGAPRTLAVPGAALAFAAYAPDGARLVTGTRGGRAQLWDAATGAAGPTLTVGGADLTAGAFTPDGTAVVVGAVDGTLTLVELATGAPRATLTATSSGGLLSGGDPIDRLRFAADGSLVVGFASARAMIVDGATLAVRGTRDGRPVATLPDGRLVTLAVDGRVLIDAPGGGAPQVLAGGARSVLAVAAAPDGGWVATADQAGVVRVFDLASGAVALTLTPAGIALPTALAFVDGGRALAIGGSAGALRIVPLEPSRAVAQACALLRYFDRAADTCD